MFYMYLLQSEQNSKLYIGSTSDLKQRFRDHNQGRSKATKSGRPWKLVYYEAYSTLRLAQARERNLKRFAKGFGILKRRIGL